VPQTGHSAAVLSAGMAIGGSGDDCFESTYTTPLGSPQIAAIEMVPSARDRSRFPETCNDGWAYVHPVSQETKANERLDKFIN
jgi:hypothetical protein